MEREFKGVVCLCRHEPLVRVWLETRVARKWRKGWPNRWVLRLHLQGRILHKPWLSTPLHFERKGISTDGMTPKSLDEFDLEAFDMVISMGCGVHCPAIKIDQDWALEDPVGQAYGLRSDGR